MQLRLGELIQGVADFKVRGRPFRIQINPPNNHGYRYMRIDSLESNMFHDELMPPQETSSEFISKGLGIVCAKERNSEAAKQTASKFSGDSN